MKIKAYGVCIYKRELNTIKILLCKSTTSHKRWGFVKGVSEGFETKEDTAIREFKEESSIIVQKHNFEHYFEQQNNEKDIGIFLVNYKNVPGIELYFNEDQLYPKYLSWENSKVRFFALEELPKIKKKQKEIALAVSEYLKR